MNDHSCFFFFNDTATTEIYTLSLHDALPISVVDAHAEAGDLDDLRDQRRQQRQRQVAVGDRPAEGAVLLRPLRVQDRKSTRLNSSHANISYAVFCLKKKKNIHNYILTHLPTC